jgi:ubiquinone/menaquinone biosynthesis C-methylase UbiE
MKSSINGPTETHYLSIESEDLDTAFRDNQVRWHTYIETKMETLKNLDLCGHEIVLDIGCGQGHFLKILNEAYPKLTGMGIDISLCDLKKAKNRNTGDSCDYILCDATHLPFKNTCFDRTIATAILEHVDDERNVLMEMSRVLDDDGIAVVDIPSAYHLQNKLSDLFIKKHGVFPFHREYTTRRIKTVVRDAGFEIKAFTTARFEGSFLFPIIETVSVFDGRKIVWCKGRLARLVCKIGDRLLSLFGNMQFMKLLGGSWFFKIAKKRKS